MEKIFDFKKEFKELYNPKSEPKLINIPKMTFIMVDGKGDPNDNPMYQEAIEILYALSYTIKMSKMSDNKLKGYFDFVVPPLEGLWGISDNQFDFNKRDNWIWTAMIRQPDFVNQEVFEWAKIQAKKKKPSINLEKARLACYDEGLSVQIMHFGPYSHELETIEKMRHFIKENNLIEDLESNIRKHHEIYLSDPRKTTPEKLKTIIRHPVNKI